MIYLCCPPFFFSLGWDEVRVGATDFLGHVPDPAVLFENKILTRHHVVLDCHGRRHIVHLAPHQSSLLLVFSRKRSRGGFGGLLLVLGTHNVKDGTSATPTTEGAGHRPDIRVDGGRPVPGGKGGIRSYVGLIVLGFDKVIR